MNAIRIYRQQTEGEMVFSYNVYEHPFAPTNLVVRKLFVAMLDAARPRLTHVRIEYNDLQLAEKLGKRAGEVLHQLGASRETIRENKNEKGITYSRTFTAELTEERMDYFYQLKDIAQFPFYALLEGERQRVWFYFNQYLALALPESEHGLFTDCLQQAQLSYTIVAG